MRISDQKLNLSLKNQIAKTFAQVIADLKNLEESESFLKDFLTEGEFEAFSKRMAVAYWLKNGRSYTNIKENLKVSSATIAQVANMSKGKGFQLGLKKIDAELWATKWSEKIKKLVSNK